MACYNEHRLKELPLADPTFWLKMLNLIDQNEIVAMYRTIDENPVVPKTKHNFSKYRALYTGAVLQNTTLTELAGAESKDLFGIVKRLVDSTDTKYNSFYTYSANYPSRFLNNKLCILVKFPTRELMNQNKKLLEKINGNTFKCDLYVLIVEKNELLRIGNYLATCEDYSRYLERR